MVLDALLSIGRSANAPPDAKLHLVQQRPLAFAPNQPAEQQTTDSMGLRPTQPIGTKDAKQTAEIYARISQETFDQVRWGRR